MTIGLNDKELRNNIEKSEQIRSLYLLNKFQSETKIPGDRYNQLLTSYLFDDLIEKSIKSSFCNKLPILVCVVKKELVRMKKFFEYYRKIGITQFVIIDNDSTDGTLDLCINQDNANVYSVKKIYSSARRVGWINQVLSRYGRNRWYIVADADELIDYVGSDSFSINNLISSLTKKRIKRVLGLQVNFYSKENSFEMSKDSINWDDCVYFDVDSYEKQNSKRCVWYVGGPRKRVFETYSLLTKYPLFYFDNNTLNISSHYLYPFEDNFKSPCLLCIKHYEFLNQSDYTKMIEIKKNGNYANGSREYAEMLTVIQNKNILTFFDIKSSCKYASSYDLLKIKYLTRLD